MTAVAGDENAVRAVYEAIAEILPGVPPEQISDDSHLADLGADSVDRVEIILAVTGKLGVDAPLSTFGDTPTIGVLVERLTFLARRT